MMKYILVTIVLLCSVLLFGQEHEDLYVLEAGYFEGDIQQIIY